MVHYKYKYLHAAHNTSKDMFIRVKYAELKLEVKSLYLGHNANSEYRSCV